MAYENIDFKFWTSNYEYIAQLHVFYLAESV